MVISDKLIERYRVLKAQAPGCLLLMQVGAFMQAMNEDARAVAAVTGLKLQVGGDPDTPTVLGGFPKSGLDRTIGLRARHSSWPPGWANGMSADWSGSGARVTPAWAATGPSV
jgi:hypothetical protein